MTIAGRVVSPGRTLPCSGALVRRALRLLALVLLAAAATNAFALPPGREWAPNIEHEPSHPSVMPYLWTDAAGNLQFSQVITSDGNSFVWVPYTWSGSAWQAGPPSPGGLPLLLPRPLVSREPLRSLVDVTPARDVNGYVRLGIWPMEPGAIGVPETVTVTTSQTTSFAGATAGGRRWVARSEQRPEDQTGFHVRTFYSERRGEWRELPRGTDVGLMSALAPLDDHHALLVTAGFSTRNWFVIEDDHFISSGVLAFDPDLQWRFMPLVAALRPRPGNGAWLLWSVDGVARVSSFRDGAWSKSQDITIVHPPGRATMHYFSWGDMTRDTSDRPVIVWIDVGSGPGFITQAACIAFPNDHGWDPGEEIPGSDAPNEDDDATEPGITLDRFGETWVAWSSFKGGRTWWTHTFVRATASNPAVTGGFRTRALHWTLSEPAPGSTWTVERATGAGSFEAVAAVRAGPGVAMEWTDDGPPLEQVRYRVRRETVDSRYNWTSDEAVWPGATAPAPVFVNQAGRALRIELAELPAGSLTIGLYDAQGREVGRWRRAVESSGLASFDLLLDARGHLGPGIYFVRLAHDVRGRISTTKVAVIE